MKIKNIAIIIIIVIILQMFSIKTFATNSTYNQKIISAQQVRNNGINNFPESYQILLNKLVEKMDIQTGNLKHFIQI